jgi:ketosteroid isomerase-like protein
VADVIAALYDALNRHDGEAAAACYTPDAVFEDPAFGRLEDGRVRDMWRMLTERSPDLEVTLLAHGSEGDTGWAQWRARYTFSGTGNPVTNEIDARFQLRDGLIAEHLDTFSLRRWGSQALGRRGTLLGAVGALGPIVRRQARAGLDRHAGGAA